MSKKITCRIEELVWLTPTVMGIRFEPEKKFQYEAGQFVCVFHDLGDGSKPARRAYSFSSPHPKLGYELCIRHVADGRVSGAFSRMKPGDKFVITAPHGDFHYETPPDRRAMFISIGSGVAPFRSMVRSDEFLDNPPTVAYNLFGARTMEEIIYPGFFESVGVETINAISDEKPGADCFHGRVTDYLKQLPADWDWANTDFYLCGNGAMVADVRAFLIQTRGVSPRFIRQEIYFTPSDRVAGIKPKVVQPLPPPSRAVPPPFTKKKRAA